ncbi:radical SAM protein [Microseira sp. BLCC-F43]|jgi:oxygen-independent coproporphyrinogen-3 oxidase|uniref:radical SAM protein n=1 Tax=Microseira sp. BLCC-F43 TaxID=3153602 RepID=UPI0035BB3F60
MEAVSNQANCSQALKSLNTFDPNYPPAKVVELLNREENVKLYNYITEDPFGAHHYPGTTALEVSDFHFYVNEELEKGEELFLWAYIPLCNYKCYYCQFPVVLQSSDPANAKYRAKSWVDYNIKEAMLWQQKIPKLKTAPIGEFCLFGGTPTQIPMEELGRLIDLYKENFNFTQNSTIRVEGSPDSLNQEMLEFLYEKGCRKISYGIQSFNDELISLSGRGHSGQQAIDTLLNARKIGFERITGDLIYGLVNQTISDFEKDVKTALEYKFDTVVTTKLHLGAYEKTGTAISGISPAKWQNSEYREKLTLKGLRWPTLGEQYQMRELAVKLFAQDDRSEYPTMYFQKKATGPERWKSLQVDQNKQNVEIGIGLGGSSHCSKASGVVEVNPKFYQAAIEEGKIPLTVKGYDQSSQEASSLRKSLSTCQPVFNSYHVNRFPHSNLLKGHWGKVFRDLERRELLSIDESSESITLSQNGKTLVEAIMNTEI